MNTVKRLLSVALSLMFVLSCGVFGAGISVSAATTVTTWSALVSAASKGGDVVLGANITGTDMLTVSADLTVDLGGYTLSITDSGSSSSDCGIYALGTTSADLVIKGSGTLSATGYSGIRLYANASLTTAGSVNLNIKANTDTAIYSGKGGGVTLGSTGTANIYGKKFGVFIRNNESATASASPFVVTAGTVNICADTDTSTNSEFNGVALCVCDAPSANYNQIQIKGGNVYATSSQKYAVSTGLYVASENGTAAGLSVSGGSLNANTKTINGVSAASDVGMYIDGKLTVSGGTVVSKGLDGAGIRASDVAISGGASVTAVGATSGITAFGTFTASNALVSFTGTTMFGLWAQKSIVATNSSLRLSGVKADTNLAVKNSSGTALTLQRYKGVTKGNGTTASVVNSGAGVSYSGPSYTDGDTDLYIYGTSNADYDLALRTGSKLSLTDGYTKQAGTGMTVAGLKENFKNTNTLSFLDTSGNTLSESATVATGTVVKSFNGNTLCDSTTLIVTGDCNCDGIINASDYSYVSSYLSGNASADGVGGVAADMNFDTLISTSDLISYKSIITGDTSTKHDNGGLNTAEYKGVEDSHSVTPYDIGISDIIKGLDGDKNPPVGTDLHISRSASGNYYVCQGGCSDGTYYYMALYDNHSGTSTSNKSLIYKYNLATGALVKTSGSLPLDHANDIGYNADTNELIVSHCKDRVGTTSVTYKLSFIDPDTLTVKRTHQLSKTNSSVAYSAAQNKYVFGKGATYHIYDENLSHLKTVSSSLSAEGSSNYVVQGNDCDDQYIYFIRSHESLTDNHLVIYDWSGNFITYVTIPIAREGEHVFHVGDKLYVACYYSGDGGRLYEVNISQ